MASAGQSPEKDRQAQDIRLVLHAILRWRGPLVPTAPPNSSVGAGWIIPAFQRKKHRIGAGPRRFTQKTRKVHGFLAPLTGS